MVFISLMVPPAEGSTRQFVRLRVEDGTWAGKIAVRDGSVPIAGREAAPMADGERGEANWPEAMAEVTRCRYDMRAGRALAFGLSSKQHFRLAYSYRVGEELYTGECFSDVARPQGSLFAIRYDPDLPHEHRSGSEPSGIPQRVPLLAIGVAGSVVLSLGWLLVMRGCS